jgi:hypothetical protein
MQAAPTRSRLTEVQRADRALTGTELQRMVMQLGGMLGWASVHFRAAKTERGWRVPVEGPLGKGWPDLVMVHVGRSRTLAVELKRELGDVVSPDQEYVHSVLRAAGWTVRVWRPSDLSSGAIQAELAGGSTR